ncbi:MAG: DUF971 domain-containing protein [Pseudomonadota bacterium]
MSKTIQEISEQELETKFWPKEIRYNKAEKSLEIDFDNGQSFSYSAEYLRVESPSAEVQGHNPNQKVTIAGRRHVGIMELEPVGNYAVRLKFDDLHETGIFSWQYLYRLGAEKKVIWRQYLADLERQGLSRDP